MSALFTLPKQVPVNSSGTPYPGAKLYFYAAGTTTAQNVYTDIDLTDAHPQPVVADANGRFAPIYLDPNADADYRVQLYTLGSVLIYDEDNYPKSGISRSSVGQTLWPVTDAETSAGITPTNYYYAPGNVLRYGAAGDGATDDTAAFISAHSALPAAGGKITVPAGSYLITGEVEFTKRTILEGVGFSNADAILGATTLIKEATVATNLLTLSATGCVIRDLTIQGQSGNSGDGIQIAAGRGSLQNVGVFGMGGSGIRIGTDSIDNCNLWSLFNVHSSGNDSHGIHISSNTYPTPPDVNAGTAAHVNCASNGDCGVYIAYGWYNAFYGLTLQGNTSYGVRIGPHSHGNTFYGGDWDEANGTADLYRESGAARTYVNGTFLNYTRIVEDAAGAGTYLLCDYDTGVGTPISRYIRDGVNYFLCTEANGSMAFVTGGLSGSTANSPLVLNSDGTVVIGRGADSITAIYKGTVTWNPSSVADGAVTSTTLTVTGASIGDQVSVGFEQAVPAGAFMVGSVTATNTVTVTLFNKTGAPLDLGSGTLRATVIKQ